MGMETALRKIKRSRVTSNSCQPPCDGVLPVVRFLGLAVCLKRSELASVSSQACSAFGDAGVPVTNRLGTFQGTVIDSRLHISGSTLTGTQSLGTLSPV